MSLSVAAASTTADHALGGFAAIGTILLAEYLGAISLGDDASFLVTWIGIASIVIWLVLAAYLWHIQGGRGRLERRRRDFSFDGDVFDEALRESETLRRNVVGLALDDEVLEAALDESPTFSAHYLEEEARS